MLTFHSRAAWSLKNVPRCRCSTRTHIVVVLTVRSFRCRNFIWNYFFNQIFYKTISFFIFAYLNIESVTSDWTYIIDRKCIRSRQRERKLLEVHKVRVRRKESKCSKMSRKKRLFENNDSSNYSFGFAHREEVARSEKLLSPSKNQYGDKDRTSNESWRVYIRTFILPCWGNKRTHGT